MKKFTVAVLIIGVFIIYSLLYNHSNPIALLPNNTIASGSSNRPSSSATVLATPTTTDSSGTTSTPSSAASAAGSPYKDGTYTGSVANAQWGYIQVKVVIQQGKITDVPFLQYPNDHNRSIMINNYADPQLTSEAIQAQSANVDIVSGATDSSEAFMQSLSDALAKAKV